MLYHLFGRRSDPFPQVNSLNEVEVGEGQKDLADNVVPLSGSIQVENFEQERPFEHLAMCQLVGEALIEDGILRLALHLRLSTIPLIR